MVAERIGESVRPIERQDERRLVLEDFLPFLIARMVPLIDRASQPYFAPFEVTREMFRVIMVLYQRGPLSLGELADQAHINFSTLSRQIGRMERRKLLRRRKVNGSKLVEIELSPIGRRKCEALIPLSLEFETRITSQFSGEQIALFKDMLRQVYQAYLTEIRADEEAGYPASSLTSSDRSAN